jgi:hypothetical protein
LSLGNFSILQCFLDILTTKKFTSIAENLIFIDFLPREKFSLILEEAVPELQRQSPISSKTFLHFRDLDKYEGSNITRELKLNSFLSEIRILNLKT